MFYIARLSALMVWRKIWFGQVDIDARERGGDKTGKETGMKGKNKTKNASSDF